MSTGWALLAAGLSFVLFMVVKTRFPFWLDDEGREARDRLAQAKERVRSASEGPARAAALREAARVALEEVGRPNLAASLARRAERADPDSPDSVSMMAAAMRRASRYRALERQLWRKLASVSSGPAHDRAFDELLALYEGPMRRPEQARVLRRLRSGAATEG